eukprot:TRINITY_DN23702_c0_g1_i1.p1 TRINITY_DN23702_c0_g1~~TRINITY_DN23702_c0_g1_i1.p1  ORF type:complete len:332 (+),score=52.85 TRINITY_DN23702_c0_g1_i1:57-1052(+)
MLRGACASLSRQGGTSMVAAAQARKPAPVGQACATQARFATRVGFWRIRRKLRNPFPRIKKPQMLSEDTRSQAHWYYMMAYHYELKKWRKIFQDAVRHQVTEYEMSTEYVKHGKPDAAVRQMLVLKKGYAPGDTRRLTVRDNPFAMTGVSRTMAKDYKLGFMQKGRLSIIMEAQNKTMEEARKVVIERKAKSLVHRAKMNLRSTKGGLVGRLNEAHRGGKASVHGVEVTNRVDLEGFGEEGGGDGKENATLPRPRKSYVFHDRDPETHLLRILHKPELNFSPVGVHPMKDHSRNLEVQAAPGYSVQGSGYIFTSRSQLAKDFDFPFEVEMK